MISGIVLAAGLSTRMGRPKQGAIIAGRPMLERAVRAFVSSKVDEVIVVVGKRVDSRSMPREPRLKFVINIDPTKGLSSSLRLGLLSVGHDCEAAVIGLGDKPLLLPSTIDLLIATYRETGSKVVVPTFKGTRGNPVLFDRSLFPLILSLRGDVGAKSIISKNESETIEVGVNDEGILLDVDTPSDLKDAEAALKARRLSGPGEPGD